MSMSPEATPTPGSKLLTPKDHTLIMIDFQSQMAFATKSIDAVTLRNNAALVAHAASGFGVSTILTTVAAKTFSGPMFGEITDAFPGQKLLDRTSMNTWEDAAVIKQLNEIGKGRIVLAGLWTSVCIVGPALSALDQGFNGPHGAAGGGASNEGTAVPVGIAARLGPQRDLRADHRHRQELRRRLRRRRHLRQDHVRRLRGALTTRWSWLGAGSGYPRHPDFCRHGEPRLRFLLSTQNLRRPVMSETTTTPDLILHRGLFTTT
jgi:Isochorismatase family